MHVAVVGGGAAGMTAASRIRAIKPEWKVSVFEASSFVSHAPCGIPYAVAGITDVDGLMYYPPEFFVKERGIDLHTNAKVVEAGYGYLLVEEGGKEKKYWWDVLILATGASPVIPRIDGVGLENIFTVDLPPDAERIIRARGENVVIVGSGYIGLEMAEALSNKKVTVIETLEHPLPNFDADIASVVTKEVKKKVNLRLNERVVAFEGKDRVERVITDKGEYKADFVILAVGAEPNVELAKQIGVRLGETGAIEVDEHMRTNIDEVFAAGDCVETTNLVTGKKDWIPLAPVANKMGYVAGVNACGGSLEFPGAIGAQITRFHDLEIGKAGLSETEAKKEGLDVQSVMIKTRAEAHYCGSGEIWLKMVVDENKRLLGVQAVGKSVFPRINAAAIAIQNGLTTKDVFFSDLPYAPPFSPVWDPLIVAARKLRF
ncbi:FAD-dependent oxidoreductase [Archaeoglobus veneficus]|uniref:CoA-disulfide reductase n=1 Tax=Archaeoglobus veneficus (strain DSM 11195 / SNP6) TaxID=693661 RepID=F2KQT2_ARCVS|nr:FAD-dependent oxidoreductase [Archaeoglobus veneficus]AEA46644.1 CoA-disulfide reductase [Archaeoglobus veneficus SNP6]